MESTSPWWPWEADIVPRPWKLGALAAALVLASQMVQLFPIASRMWQVSVLGLWITFSIGASGLVAAFIALFVLSGLEWILQDHPGYAEHRHLSLHAILPTLAAWTLEMALLYTPATVVWWVVLLTGSLLLVAVLVAEYVAVDTRSPGYWLAQAGLGTLGFVLFFLLSLYVRLAQWRLLWALALLAPVAAVLTLRLFYLYTFGRWCWVEVAVISLLITHTLMVLYVYPLSPLGFAFAITAVLYVLHSLLRSLQEGHNWQEALREPLWLLVLLGGVLVWLEWR